MYKAMMRFATPFTTGLFVISLVSGVALFFHVGTSYFREMHEWLSMVLILPFLLHLMRNWRPFLSYFKHVPMAVALAVSLGSGGVFAWQGMTAGPGGNPAMAVVRAMEKSPIAAAAPIFGHTAESLSAALAPKGYRIESPDKTLEEIAKASEKSGIDLIRDIAAARQ